MIEKYRESHHSDCHMDDHEWGHHHCDSIYYPDTDELFLHNTKTKECDIPGFQKKNTAYEHDRKKHPNYCGVCGYQYPKNKEDAENAGYVYYEKRRGDEEYKVVHQPYIDTYQDEPYADRHVDTDDSISGGHSDHTDTPHLDNCGQ